jgi:hypothetical protein
MVRNVFLVLSSLLIASCGGGSGGGGEDGGPAGFAPVLSVDGVTVGTQPVVVSIEENTTEVAVVTSSGGTLAVSGDDGALFALAADGQLSFLEAPDFESPAGSLDDGNSYSVRVEANGTLSAAVTLTVQVTNVAEGAAIDGRVVDGPVSGAAVYVDMNCNKAQDKTAPYIEPSGTSDESGFFKLETELELTEGCAGKFYSIGGTDIASGKVLENIQLSADLPTQVAALDEEGKPVLNADGSAKQVFPPVAVTPLTTIIAAAESAEEKEAVLVALGLGGVSVQEALTIDPWAGSQDTGTSEEAVAASAVAQAIQRVNTQVATIIKVAASIAKTTTTGEQTAAQSAAALASAVEAVSQAIVKKAVVAVAESVATGLPVEVNLASADVIESVIEETVLEVAKAEAIAAGSSEADAAVAAAAKVAQVQAVITTIASKVEIVNTAVADESVNPTSELGVAIVIATENTVIAQVVETVAAIKEVIDAGGSAADIAAVVVAEIVKIEEITVDVILAEVVSNTTEALPDLDKDGIPDVIDTDDDGDGVPDNEDAFPRDPTESVDTDGDGIGNNKDLDDDNDGVSDLDEIKQGTDPLNPDTDGDKANDKVDNCPINANADQLDTDKDGQGNVCDDDDDNDGVSDLDEIKQGTDPLLADTDGDKANDKVDNCPVTVNADQLDTDKDGAGDVCDADRDGDSIANGVDNCPLIANKDQANLDKDALGDVCDTDKDGDTVLNDVDNCPSIANTDQANLDKDTFGDVCDADRDGDKVLNEDDEFPDDATESKDTDSDTIGDNADNCPAVANKDQADLDEDGLGNVCDADRDGDGVDNGDDEFPDNASFSVSAFKLNSVSISDYVDQDRSKATYPTTAIMGSDGVLSLALADGVVIDRSNLKNLVDGDTGSEMAPSLVLAMDQVPVAGTSGTIMVKLMLMENDDGDATHDAGERKLTASVSMDWKSDGTDISVSVPASRKATLTYEHDSTSYELESTNLAADMFTVNKSDNYSNLPASLEIRALGLFANAVAANEDAADFNGLNLGNFFDGADDYYVGVTLTQDAKKGNIFYKSGEVLVTGITANMTLGEVPGRFNLHRVGLLDFVDGMNNKAVVYGLSPMVSTGGKLSVAMGTGNVVDLSNLKSLVDSNGSTGMAPRLLLAMDSVPASGESGAMELTITLLEGADASQEATERMLTGSITANWSADASGDVAVTVPAQSLSMTYTKGSTTATVTGANGASDMITLSQSKAFENFPATLEVRILDWFTAANKTGAEFAGIDLAGFFEAGDYIVNVDIDQGTDEVLYYRRAENAALLTSLQASLKVGEAVTTTDKYDVMVDDWSTMSSSPVELHVSYPTLDKIRLHPAVNGKTLEFDFGPSKAIKKAHVNDLLSGNSDALVPALQFKMANVPTLNDAFALKMTVSGGDLTMASLVDVSYNGSNFTVPSQTQDVTVTDSNVCQTGCTFTLESTAETLDISLPGIYPPTLSAKLVSLFDLNLAGRNSEVTVELQAGKFDLVIEVLAAGTELGDKEPATVDNILTYGGVPINRVEGTIIIE